jgi:DNA (cytosine-5)-methyltransferase 1
MPDSFLNTLSNKKIIPQVLDLFSGCGGFSYGFKLAGYDIAGGIDLDESAANTASYNLYWKDGIDRDHLCDDIRTFNLLEVTKEINKQTPLVVIGGPPCQAYSQIGRAKLKSLGDDRVHTKDKRGMLFQDFIKTVIELDSDVAVMENVLESVNYGGMNIPHTVCEIFQEYGYDAKWTVLNAANYGVPQVRERVFVFASKIKNINCNILPQATHRSIDNKMTPGTKREKRFKESVYFLEPHKPNPYLRSWVTVGEALSDLPSLFTNSKDKYQFYPINLAFPYKTEVTNEYQELMRSHQGQLLYQITGHGYRRTLRDFPIFERMMPGDNYIEASEIAEKILGDHCSYYGIDPLKNKNVYEKIRKKIVPPYSKEKFTEKWKKLDPNMPSHTLVAHLSTDTYTHIHPWEPRGISVREAARIQSFPDIFTFQCTMGDAFKQIGNAVPPLLSKAIATGIIQWMVE